MKCSCGKEMFEYQGVMVCGLCNEEEINKMEQREMDKYDPSDKYGFYND